MEDVTIARLSECRHATEARYNAKYSLSWPTSIPANRPLSASEQSALRLLPLSLECRRCPGQNVSKALLYSSAMADRPKRIKQAIVNLLVRGMARIVQDDYRAPDRIERTP